MANTGGTADYSHGVMNFTASRSAKVAELDLWLFDIHNRLLKIEEENILIKSESDKKDEIIRELTQKVKKLEENKSVSSTSTASTAWSSLFDSKNQKNNKNETILLEKMARESRARESKECNIIISGLKNKLDGTKEEKDKHDLDEVCLILEEMSINSLNKVKRTHRLPKSTKNNDNAPSNTPPLLLVELSDKDTQKESLSRARDLRNSTGFKNVFINKDLTLTELEVERELRKERNKRNSTLEEGEGRLKFGKSTDGKEFYWGVRFGKICKIDRQTKHTMQ